MSELLEFGKYLYAYCTDFVINLANIFDLSYYEINFILFAILYPLLTIGSILFFIVQKIRLRRIKNRIN